MEFKCKFCTISKANRWTWQMHHLKMHYYCDNCDSKFENRNETLEHQKIVHDKTFQCKVCSKLFFEGGYLNSHMIVHNGVVDEKPKKQYFCDICDFSTKNRTTLEDHNIAKHLQKKDLSCFQCDYTTGVKANLRKHERRMHQELPTISCDKCDYTFKGFPGELKRHQSRVHDENRPTFKCDHCSKEFLGQQNFQSHIRLFHKNQKYKCEVCGKETRTITMHKIHLKSHLGIEDQLKCDQCDTFVTYSKYKLAIHKKSNHQVELSLECNMCKHESKSHSDHREHIKTHKGVDNPCDHCDETFKHPYVYIMHLSRAHYICHKCKQKFRDQETVLNHLRDVHEIHYECDQCPKRYFEGKHLSKHKREIHQGIRLPKRHPCELCTFISPTPSQLKTHKAAVHLQTLEFSCDICDFCSNWDTHITRHKNTVHNKEKLPNLTCEICGFSTVYKNGLKAHQKTHIEKQFKCDTCGKKLSTKPSLISHMKVYHENQSKDKAKLPCELCGKELSDKESLRLHFAKIHFTCLTCDQNFDSSDEMLDHLHIVHQIEFKCNVCSSRHFTKKELRKHMNSVHGSVT